MQSLKSREVIQDVSLSCSPQSLDISISQQAAHDFTENMLSLALRLSKQVDFCQGKLEERFFWKKEGKFEEEEYLLIDCSEGVKASSSNMAHCSSACDSILARHDLSETWRRSDDMIWKPVVQKIVNALVQSHHQVAGELNVVQMFQPTNKHALMPMTFAIDPNNVKDM